MQGRIKPLSSARPGEMVRMKGILAGGAGFLRKLLLMGIVPGQEMRIVQRMGNGTVVVQTRKGRFVIGRGVATRIGVQEVGGNAEGR